MTKVFKYIISIIIVIYISSCREPFTDYQVNTDQKILVIDGMITDTPGPYLVHITEAVPFKEESVENVKGAMVYVKDEMGNTFVFNDKNNGYYISDSASFKGEIGKTYTLYITGPDGLEYKSTPCKIGPKSRLDKVYGFNETYLLYPKGTDGNLNDVYANAVHLYADISFDADQRMNTRLDAILATTVIMDQMQYIYAPHYDVTPIYEKDIWGRDSSVIGVIRKLNGYERIDSFSIRDSSYSTSTVNKLPVIKTNIDYQSGSKLNKVSMGYMNLNRFSEKVDDSTTISYSSPWILQMRAYTISNETFNYLFNMSKQLGGKNSLFEPLPIQLQGNITCISDSTNTVLGLFQANSVVIKYISIDNSWKPTDGFLKPRRDTTYFNFH